MIFNLGNDYEKKFAEKIYLASGKPYYAKLQEKAQNCIYEHTGFGLSAIMAQDFMDKIISMTDEQFIDFYNQAVEQFRKEEQQ